MIELLKSQPKVTIVKIKDHQATYTGEQLPDAWTSLIESIRVALPDMSFAVNGYKEPRIIKNGCSQEEDWRQCSCNKEYQIPPHPVFIKPCTWKPIYHHVPLFSGVTLP